jgi:hypothetical protein
MRFVLLFVPLALAAMPMPPAFESNAGQAPADVRYIARTARYSALLRDSDVVIKGVGIAFEGAAPDIAAEQPDKARVTFFRGSMPPVVSRRYSRVRYSRLYPGVDAVFHITQGELEYDLILAPHADVSRVRLRFTGARAPALSPEGDIVIATCEGELRHRRPRVFQDGRQIAARYILRAGGRASIALGAYDRARPMLVDPSVQFATLYGGSGADTATAVAVDSQGYVYVAGATTSVDLPGAHELQSALNRPITLYEADAFVAKVTPDGSSLVFAVYLGGSDENGATGIGVDGEGNVFATGYTQSTRFPTTDGAWIRERSRDKVFNGWLAKIDPSGSKLLYSSYLGPIGGTYYNGAGVTSAFPPYLKVDAAGYAYVAGSATGATFGTTPGAYQGTRAGESDAFVLRMNRAGSAPVFATLLGGSQGEYVSGLAVDSAGNVYVSGSSASNDFPMARPPQPVTPFSPGWFLAKLNSSGTDLLYATFFRGTIAAVAVDSADAAWISGSSGVLDLPIVNPIWPTAPPGWYLARFDPSGAVLHMATWVAGQTRGDTATRLASDGSRMYLLGPGIAASVATAGAIPAADYANALIAIDTQTSQVIYATRLPGPATAVAPGPSGEVVVAGTAFGVFSNFVTTPGAMQSQYASPSVYDQRTAGDAYLARISTNNPKPSLSGVSPETGTLLRSVELAGSGFVVGSQVLWNGTPHAATVDSPNRISVTLNDSDWTPGQIIRVAVANLEPGGGISEERTIAALSPEPGAVSLSPARIAAGSDETKVLVRASGIIATSELRWNSSLRSTRLVAPATLELTVPAGDLVLAGTVTISLTNSSPGGGTASAILIITTPDTANTVLPGINQAPVAPVNAPDAGRSVIIAGFGFTSNSTVRWNGAERATEYLNANTLRVALTPEDVARPGRVDVTVSNPGGLSSSTSGYVYVPVTAADLAWEPVAGRFYASTASGIARIDPASGVETVFPAAGTPGPLAVSGDGRYLYVGAVDQPTVQRIDTQSGLADAPYLIDQNRHDPSSPARATAIRVHPSSITTIAVARGDGGYLILDAGIPRPYDSLARGLNVSGPFLLTDSALLIQNWFYTGSEPPGQICLGRLTLDTFGIASYDNVCDAALVTLSEVRHEMSAWLFVQNGRVEPLWAEGPWRATPFGTAVAVNLDRRRAYALTPSNSFGSAARLAAYDLDTLALVWSTQFPIGTRKLELIPWGVNGLAALNYDGVYLLTDPQ